MVSQFVRRQQGPKRLGKPRHVLGDVDQRHGEIARRAQHRQAERAHQHDIAGRRPPRLPERDRPGEKRERSHDDDEGVQQPQFFQIAQAALAGIHFMGDVGVEAASARGKSPPKARTSGMLAITSTISPSTAAALLAKSPMQGPSRRRQTKHDRHARRPPSGPRRPPSSS